jgi:hypothetical protein
MEALDVKIFQAGNVPSTTSIFWKTKTMTSVRRIPNRIVEILIAPLRRTGQCLKAGHDIEQFLGNGHLSLLME